MRALCSGPAAVPRLFPLVLLLFLVAAPAEAQQRLRLGPDDDRWEAAPRDTGDPSATRLSMALEALARRQWERAEVLATDWIDRNPGHPLLAEAYLVRAEALFGRGEEYRSLYDYELICRRYPGAEAFVTACERQLEIAVAYLAGRKRRLLGLRILGAEEEGEELLIRVQERLPGSQIAERAALELADWYYRESKMGRAAEMYGIFLANFPRSASVELARRRLIYAHLAAYQGPEHDPSGLDEARTRLEDLDANNPAAARRLGSRALLIRIEESAADKLLTTARWYERSGDPISAERTLRRLVRAYPASVATRDAIPVLARLIARLPAQVMERVPEYRALGLVGTAGRTPAPAVSGEGVPE
ncbi:MAG: outer membrane protein assembly factor BamD [Phycisphaeraceae bacterium]|nr:outer membrane protein assembly factor BamD [Phycisphaeraceae bacterium]